MSDPIAAGGRIQAMNALWALAEGRRVAEALADAGFEAMVLRGPELQQRVLGTSAAYMSGDLDVLVRPRDFGSVSRWLGRHGFRSHPSNGALRRLSGRAMYERAGFAVDLHRSVEVPPYPMWKFRRLTRELWRGASTGPGGFVEPRFEPLTVFLATYAAARRSAPSVPVVTAARAASAHVADPTEMWRIAGRDGVSRAVRGVLEDRWTGSRAVDGPAGFLAWWLGRATHGDLLSPRWKARGREVVSYHRQGLHPFLPRKAWATVSGERMQVWEGVCGPGAWTDDLIDAWLGGGSGGGASRILVEIGTGTGALAILAQIRHPGAEIHATDLSFRAVQNARANARFHHREILVHEGDLFSALPGSLKGRVHGIVAHLPSLPPGGYREDEDEEREDWAPVESYVGQGGDGLDLVRRLLIAARGWLSPDGRLVVSMRAWQWESFKPEASSLGYEEHEVIAPSDVGAIIVMAEAAP